MKSYISNIVYKTNSITIPVFEIGNFQNGFGVLVAQIHGDEYSGRLICQKFIRSKFKINKGVRIIACANPDGAKLGVKNEPLTNINLNRIFISEKLKPESMASSIANKIFELCKGADFVIDLHDMPGSQIPLCAIITLTENNIINKQNYNLANIFYPGVLWVEDFRNLSTSKRYIGTINNYLCKFGIPNFTIETNPLDKINEKEIDIVIRKIIRLLNTKPIVYQKSLNLIRRYELFAPSGGIIIPCSIPLLAKIKRGEKLATVLNEKLEKIDIISPLNGLLIRKTIARNIQKKEKIFDIGKKVLWKH
ncbi:MAG: hypothetical protein US60_C0009G0019 [Microgenomates group bacterium GW2011_GWC1_37_8]|uniref:Succinylglutamate desuccinylase/Aspartoacylase catalytic domain-containing protein n=1 Tax=Candidatus Woesebacteria bacterium GW2011_GWB1_38_8 TaxID=1618570 RepID=A0A0G0P9D5_9BACT|nr:MAG: hypothetical protein US60_C0009G0019 [Microgenomates group bacterium GW2011_GWC1_37_8]KKQ85936.1 MAG: hypothetical protein UT08_C0003G0099 [Candidatus Woesebacteria bacterium GW2011_GWB1_38_8]